MAVAGRSITLILISLPVKIFSPGIYVSSLGSPWICCLQATILYKKTLSGLRTYLLAMLNDERFDVAEHPTRNELTGGNT